MKINVLFIEQKFLLYSLVISFTFNQVELAQNEQNSKTFDKNTLENYKNRVKFMFYHAYDNYIFNAYPYDELQPISCKGFDTWGSYSLTLIDSLDMLIILGNRTEFERVVQLLATNLDFNKDINVSVFETNIRIIGGLLSSHILSYRLYLNEDSMFMNDTKNLHPKWPCDGPLLQLAVKLAQKIIPAFNTTTGMPYGTINLKKGVPEGETAETCVAGVGTFLIEFSTLSRLTGDPQYEKIASKAMDALWTFRSSLELLGNHINVQTGKWTGIDATIGSGVDSYFEYLVKAGILLDSPQLIQNFRVYQRAIDRFLAHENWFVWANMEKGQKIIIDKTLPLFSSLEAFYPGLLTLTGDLKQAVQVFQNYHKIWRKYGGLPEFYNIQSNTIHSNREAYPLRPELIESLMYIIRATNNDNSYYEIAIDYLESIESISKLNCGFATVKDVKDHRLEDRMESFFLAETLKYLYLIFDQENFLHNNLSKNSHKIIQNEIGECPIETGYVIFNTEAHAIDGAALECCQIFHMKHNKKNEYNAKVLEEINPDKLLEKYITFNSEFVSPDFSNYIQKEYEEINAENLIQEKKIDSKFQKLCERMRNTNIIVEEVNFVLENSCPINDTFKFHAAYFDNKSFYP